MFARAGKFSITWNTRNPGEIISIIEEQCVPGATLPRAEPEEWSYSDGFFAEEQKLRERLELVQRQVNLPKFLFLGREAIAAAPIYTFCS